MSAFEALHIPPEALEKGGVEILRAAIIEDGLHVSLQPAFDDAGTWGAILADIVRYVAEAYAEDTGGDAAEIAEQIRDQFNADLDNPDDAASAKS